MNALVHAMREVLQPPSAGILAMRELEVARRELLCAYTAQEYASAMVTYGQDRIARLERHLTEPGG